MKTIFIRLLDAGDKAAALVDAIRNPEVAPGSQRFEIDVKSFSAIPRSPFAYWISDYVRQLFVAVAAFENDGRLARAGLQTSDDFRFVRAWWEVGSERINSFWWSFAKGGAFSPFHANINLTVNWNDNGHETKSYAEVTPGSDHWSRNLRSAEHYFRPGLTWLRRSHRFCATELPAMSLFSDGAQAILARPFQLESICAAANSSAFDFLIKLAVGRTGSGVQFMPGMVATTPLPIEAATDNTLAMLFRRGWSLKRSLDSRSESSRCFEIPVVLKNGQKTLAAGSEAWAEYVHTTNAALAVIQTKIDARCFDLYGFDEGDRRSVTEGFSCGGGELDETNTEAEADEESDVPNVNTSVLAAELVAWAVGVAFGRFDTRLATGERQFSAEREPFEPLPVCSPAMLTGDGKLPLASAPTGYPIAFLENGILVDDRGHARDFTTAVLVVFDEVFKSNTHSWWNEVGTLLDPKDHDLRAWLASGFFEHHLKHYSKSRRKAPIFWQLSVPSSRYSIWLYAHRLSRDSFFQIQNDVVSPKLAHEERQLTSLIQSAGANPPAKERKEISEQEAFVGELRSFLDEVKRVAPLWNPMLDDGVALTMAPLWRLVPQHKAWQKELKSKWDELVAGKYDWAHLAMHLWPERVVPRCAKDRSLSIAHGLENVFWMEGEDGKWKQRPTPTRSLEELVRELTSSAAKAAMKSLLETPVAIAGGSKARGRRHPGSLS